MSKIEELVIAGAARTPFSFGNKLQSVDQPALLQAVLEELPKRYNFDPKEVGSVTAGAVQQDTKAPNVARIAAQRAGYPDTTTDYSIQNNCNSGFVGLHTAMGKILLGDSDFNIAAGVESMSNFGYRIHGEKALYGSADEMMAKIKEDGAGFLQDYSVVSCLEEGLKDADNDMAMIEIAELMANIYGISRQEQDDYTIEMLKRAVAAVEENKMSKYIVPVAGMEKDTYPLNRKRMLKRPENFGKMAPIFAKDSEFISAAQFYSKHKKHFDRYNFGKDAITPSVTMYNASIPGDGAGAAIVTTAEKAKALGLTPLLRIVSWGIVGCDPAIMGIGPAEAANEALANPKTARAKNLKMDDIDLFEIHEAFAAQVLGAFKVSEEKYGNRFDQSKLNPFGGSLAYTHPLGATNFRLLCNILSHFDANPNARTALAAGCAGGGQGVCMVFERYT